VSGILILGGVHNNKVYNNVAYNNGVGIEVSGGSSPCANCVVDNKIKNNVAVNNSWVELWAHAGGENDGTYGSSNVYEYNCFGAQSSGFIEWGTTGYSTYDAWETAYCGSDNCSHSVESDPLFVDPVNNNFHLQSNSPAIDAGTDVGLTQDFEGNPVPQGLGVDIGAYEYLSTSINCTDSDGDTYYAIDVSCPGSDDCDDTDEFINPGATEMCNGVDDDCNISTIDGSGEIAPLNSKQDGVCVGSNQSCTVGAWIDDYSLVVNYEDPEVTCDDGLDNDCDTYIDSNDSDCEPGGGGTVGGGGGGGVSALGFKPNIIILVIIIFLCIILVFYDLRKNTK